MSKENTPTATATEENKVTNPNHYNETWRRGQVTGALGSFWGGIGGAVIGAAVGLWGTSERGIKKLMEATGGINKTMSLSDTHVKEFSSVARVPGTLAVMAGLAAVGAVLTGIAGRYYGLLKGSKEVQNPQAAPATDPAVTNQIAQLGMAINQQQQQIQQIGQWAQGVEASRQKHHERREDHHGHKQPSPQDIIAAKEAGPQTAADAVRASQEAAAKEVGAIRT